MYVLTYNGKPITLETMYSIEKSKNSGYDRMSNEELAMGVCADTKQAVIDFYLHHIGFTWPERHKGINVCKIR